MNRQNIDKILHILIIIQIFVLHVQLVMSIID